MAFLRLGKMGAALVATAVLFLPVRAALPETNTGQEYALKSVFLYNFCHFIEWPEQAFASPNDPIIIGVVGQDPFGSLLEETVEGETPHGRNIRIEHYRKPADIGRCHILFVGRSEVARVDQILAAVAGKSVLTVGETEAFLDRGGMIALTADRNRVRLRISPAKVRAASLVASSKLLRVAEIKL